MSERPDDSDKPLPHDLEAERAVLGSLLLNENAIVMLGAGLEPRHFYRDAHRRIFSAMLDIRDKQKAVVEFVTLKDTLRRAGELENVGGPAYISSLVDGLPRSSNVGQYAAIVRDKALKREMIFLSTKTKAECYADSEAADSLLRTFDKLLLDLSRGERVGTLVRSRSTALFEDIERRVANKGKLTGLETGFPSLNELTLGWQPGDMVIVAARPSIGKTTLALNAAVSAMGTQQATVAFFSFEMRRLQLEYRILSSLSNVALTRVMSGYLVESDWAPISNALMTLERMKFHVADGSSMTAVDLRLECRRLKSEGGLDLIVVDYVQLMPGTVERKNATRTEELTDISRRLKELAVELDVPIMVLSQLNRAGDARGDSRPRLSDLRECGALEQDADIVLFLHRKHHREGGRTECILEKQRNGPTGTVNLNLDRDITTFVEAPDEPPAAEPEKTDEQKELELKQQRRRHFRRNRG